MHLAHCFAIIPSHIFIFHSWNESSLNEKFYFWFCFPLLVCFTQICSKFLAPSTVMPHIFSEKYLRYGLSQCWLIYLQSSFFSNQTHKEICFHQLSCLVSNFLLLLQLFTDKIHFSIVNSNARHKSYPRLPRLPDVLCIQ